MLASPTLRRPAVLAALAALALALAAAVESAHAQSCCSLVSEDEVSVVPRQRRALVTARVATKHMLFLHDSAGDVHALGSDVSATDLTLAVGGGLRLPFYDRLQLHGVLPVRLQLRSLPAGGTAVGPDSATAAGAGDASVFLRWSALDDDERGVSSSLRPSLDVFAGTKLPTGRYAEGPTARDLARTMGDGTVALLAGATMIKYVGSTHGARLSARFAHHLPRDEAASRSGYDAFTPGDQLGLTAGYWLLHGMHWLFGAALDATWTFAASARAPGGEAQTLPDTEMRQVAFGLQVTRLLRMPDLDLTLSAGSDLPLSGIASSVSWEGFQASLALRYHFVDSDGHEHEHEHQHEHEHEHEHEHVR